MWRKRLLSHISIILYSKDIFLYPNTPILNALIFLYKGSNAYIYINWIFKHRVAVFLACLVWLSLDVIEQLFFKGTKRDGDLYHTFWFSWQLSIVFSTVHEYNKCITCWKQFITAQTEPRAHTRLLSKLLANPAVFPTPYLVPSSDAAAQDTQGCCFSVGSSICKSCSFIRHCG